jgi:ribosome-associated protein
LARSLDPPPPESALAIEALVVAAAAAHLADQKKGAHIRVLELSDGMRVADYLVIATGQSRPQVKAMYEEIHARMKAAGETHTRAEGADLGWWVLVDFGDVVVHLMQPEAREYYDLDGLYRDAREVDWRQVKLPTLPLPRSRRPRESKSDSRAAASD